MRCSPRRWRNQVFALVAVLLCGTASVGAALPAAAAAPDCGAPVTVSADADSWIDQNSSSNNFGSDAIVKVRGQGPASNFRALVHFPLPSQPAGCVVESAMLRLYAAAADMDTKLETSRLASGWAENQVTWLNQPDLTGTAATILAEAGYLEWNIATQLQAEYDAGTNNGFLIRDAAEGDSGAEQQFHSREKGENPPQLVLRFRPADLPIPGVPQPPIPAVVSCGEVLLRSTLVLNDLSACLDDGLVIGAAQIIVDLGGHTIDGVGLGIGIGNNGFDSVVVRNGTVQEFDYGVRLQPGTEGNDIQGLTLQLNQLAGIELIDADGNQIRMNTLTGNHHGIALLLGTSGTVVVDNSLSANGGTGLVAQDSSGNRLERNSISAGGDLGIWLVRASDNTLLGNTASGNSDGGIALTESSNDNLVEGSTVSINSDRGIALDLGSSGNTLRGNTVAGNNDGGIALTEGSNDNLVEGNIVTQSGDAGLLVINSDRNVLDSNVSQEMSDSGISLSGANDSVVQDNDVRFNPGGLQLDGSSRNLLQRNNASNSTGIGIELGDGSLENWIVQNTANANGAQGIYLADEALEGLGNLVVRNTANGNLSDGIATGKGGHTIVANTANDNGGWGINGFLGTIDGGGNLASGNAKPEQCIVLVCKGASPGPPETTPPDTTIGSKPPASTMSTSARFTFFADHADSTFECALDGAAFAACPAPTVYSGLAAGDHELSVRATNAFGLTDQTPAGYRWTVDRTPPETTIDLGPALATPSTIAIFTFSASDNVTPESQLVYECALDGEEFLACTSPIEHTGLTVSPHELLVRATDVAGNTDPTPASYQWTVDVLLPDTNITSGPDATSASRSATFTFSGSDETTPASLLAFECALDDAAFEPCTSPHGVQGLTNGEHTLQVRSVDLALNVDPSPASYTWTVEGVPDTAAPTTAHATSPALNAAGWASRTVTVTLSAADETGGSGVQHLQYSAAGVHAIPTQTVSGAVPGATATFLLWRAGETTVTYWATDLEGNAEAPKTLVVKIDLASPTVTAPTASLDYAALPNAGTTSVPVRLDWSGADTGSGIVTYLVQRSTNGTTFTTVATLTTAGWTANVTPGVQYHYRVRAQDASGRWSSWSAAVPVRVTLVQETPSALLSYIGAWTDQSLAGASGGSLRSASAAGRSLTLTFSGREVAWVAPRSSNYGSANVTADAGTPQSVDLYAPSLQARQIVYRQRFTNSGSHTLTVAVTGTKQAASTWTHVYVDAFIVLE